MTDDDVAAVIGVVSHGNRRVWELRWRHFGAIVRPFEPDVTAYDDPLRYPQPVVVEVHPRLLRIDGRVKLLDGLLRLGFVRGRRRGQIVRNVAAAEAALLGRRAMRQARRGPPSVSSTGPCSTCSGGGADLPPGSDCWSETASLSHLSHASAAGDAVASSAPSTVVELEQQVASLTSQLAALRAVASAARPPPPPPTAFALADRQGCGSEGGGRVKIVADNPLDADMAPYVVFVDGVPVPTTVVSDTAIEFTAPPHPPGLAQIVVMCGVPPSSAGKALWLRYSVDAVPRPQSPPVVPAAVRRVAWADLPPHRVVGGDEFGPLAGFVGAGGAAGLLGDCGGGHDAFVYAAGVGGVALGGLEVDAGGDAMSEWDAEPPAPCPPLLPGEGVAEWLGATRAANLMPLPA